MLFNKTKVDEITLKAQEKERKEQEETEQLKIACKQAFSNINGIYFLKYLFKLCLWAEQDLNINNEVLIYKKGRRDIWAIIRNVIPPNILKEIEIGR